MHTIRIIDAPPTGPRNGPKPGVIAETLGADKFADALRAMAEVTSKPNVAKNHTVDIEGAVDTVFMAVDALASLHPAVSGISPKLVRRSLVAEHSLM